MRSSCHTLDRLEVVFDDDNAVANGGLCLPMTLAAHLGLRELVDAHVDLGDAAGRANASLKAMGLIASALAGGDSIDDADALRSGRSEAAIGQWMPAPSTLGTFLRSFSYDQLKAFGVGSATLGQLVAGSLLGAVVAWSSARAGARPEAREAHRRPLVLLATVVASLGLVSVAVLWPVLGTNYRGLPPTSARLLSVAAMVISAAAFTIVLWLCYRLITGRPGPRHADESGRAAGVSRRSLVAGGVGVGLAVATGGLGTALFRRSTFGYDGLQYGGPGVQAITPNDRFYVVTKNVIDPRVQLSQWRLSVTGQVDQPRTYNLDDLRSMPSSTQETTLMCISNPVGGGLQSNAVWTGVPLADLLTAAGPGGDVVEVVLSAVDGYSDTVSLAKAMEPATLVAYGMNGEPLPQRHGYPARIIVPGLFGEKHVKWVTGIELVDTDAKGFYERQGWGPNFVVPTGSRFTEPDLARPLAAGTEVALAGTAFAGDRGVAGVEVSVDDGMTWGDAELTYSGPPLAWALWRYHWRPRGTGHFPLLVRATDGNGELQASDVRDVVPQGATGFHRVIARVRA